jgi:uncharacterized protein (TIGR03492 family)
MPPRLLILSNGHGEDAIGATLVPALQAHGFALEALPIVGEGQAYQRLNIPILGPTQPMPSGGFIYGRPAALAQDLASGLMGLTLSQIAAVRENRRRFSGVVAVGDIVVLAFAWLMQAPYVLVGCAKSDYYLAGRPGSYMWHERLLLRHPRCGGVFPRDAVTTANLVLQGIAAQYLGNPMMDGLVPTGSLLPPGPGGPTIALVPGSRPEASKNFALLAEAAAAIHLAAPGLPPRLLAAIAPGLPLDSFAASGWTAPNPTLRVHAQGACIHLLPGAFSDIAHASDLAIAMAGTATEQLVGLGKPVISLPGEGPQFTFAFAEAQTRLLGESVQLLPRDPQFVSTQAWAWLGDLPRLERAAANGRIRMGPPGASGRIAGEIARRWLSLGPPTRAQ